MSKDASKAVGRYMETFVREAMARAAFIRAESDAQAGGSGDGFLEVYCPFASFSAVHWKILKTNGISQVEDLEKLAPQLLLDF